MLTKRPIQEIKDLYYKFNKDIEEVLEESSIDTDLTEHEAIIVYIASYIMITKNTLKIRNKITEKTLILEPNDFETDHFFFTSDSILELILDLNINKCNLESYKSVIDSYTDLELIAI